MRKSDLIVKKLLEAEPDANNLDLMFRLVANDPELDRAEQEAEYLPRLKKGVYAYIKWANAPSEDAPGLDSEELAEIRKSLRKAKTFKEVSLVLANYEGYPSFLQMVSDGYFV